MSRVMSGDFHRKFERCQTITCEHRDDAGKIMRRCLTMGWWFHFCRQEGEYEITLSESVDLNHFRRKLSNIQFRVEGAQP